MLHVQQLLIIYSAKLDNYTHLKI